MSFLLGFCYGSSLETDEFDLLMKEVNCDLLRMTAANIVVKILNNKKYNEWRADEVKKNSAQDDKIQNVVGLNVDNEFKKIIDLDMLEIDPFKGIKCLEDEEYRRMFGKLASAIITSGRFKGFNTSLLDFFLGKYSHLAKHPEKFPAPQKPQVPTK